MSLQSGASQALQKLLLLLLPSVDHEKLTPDPSVAAASGQGARLAASAQGIKRSLSRFLSALISALFEHEEEGCREPAGCPAVDGLVLAYLAVVTGGGEGGTALRSSAAALLLEAVADAATETSHLLQRARRGGASCAPLFDGIVATASAVATLNPVACRWGQGGKISQNGCVKPIVRCRCLQAFLHDFLPFPANLPLSLCGQARSTGCLPSPCCSCPATSSWRWQRGRRLGGGTATGFAPRDLPSGTRHRQCKECGPPPQPGGHQRCRGSDVGLLR